jgi:hypothetical protein
MDFPPITSYTHSSSRSFVLHAPPISSFLTWSFYYAWWRLQIAKLHIRRQIFKKVKGMKYGWNAPVFIHVGCGDCLLHSLLMCPHPSTVHLQVCVEAVQNWWRRLLSPGCSPCASYTWKEYTCSSCSVWQTALRGEPVLYCMWPIQWIGTHSFQHILFVLHVASAVAVCQRMKVPVFHRLRYTVVKTCLLDCFRVGVSTLFSRCTSSISLTRAVHEHEVYLCRHTSHLFPFVTNLPSEVMWSISECGLNPVLRC